MTTRAKPPPPDEEARLRHELDVHQVELATQNEELRTANLALTAVKERYRELYDLAPMAYFTLDQRGAIIETNLAGAEMFGLERNAVLGRSFEDVIAPASRESFRAFHRSVLTEGGRPILRTVLSRPRTTSLFVRIEGSRLGAPDALDACLLCITDETEHRRTEEERRKLEARVAEALRIDSLGILAGGIAHDLNNFLAGPLANADLLFADEKVSERTREAALDIRDGIERAARLSDQMLAYSGRGRLQSIRMDVSELVSSMHRLLASAAPRVTLSLDLAEGLPSVVGDKVRLQQVVLNLVVNAAEALGPGGGRVGVKTSSMPCAEGRSGERVVIEVSDDGPGMDTETLSRIFDPFFSTKFVGRGLGLAVVHGSVRAHDGTIEVVSKPGAGTTFRVALPASQAEIAPAPSPSPPDAALKGSGTVLVVDDTEEIRSVVGIILKRCGFEVELAEDGIDALERVESLGGPEHLTAVILDLTMPRLDGWEVLAKLKSAAPSLPVVIMSGYSERGADEELMARADGFLPKPFTMNRLVDVVRTALTRSR